MRTLLWLIVVGFGLLPSPPPALADELDAASRPEQRIEVSTPGVNGEDRLDAALADWRALNARINTIKYVFSGTVQRPDLAPAGAPKEAGMPTLKEKRIFYLDLEKGLLRKELICDGAHEIRLFDRKHFQDYFPREANADMRTPDAKYAAELVQFSASSDIGATFSFEASDYAVLTAHGCFFTKEKGFVTTRQLRVALDADSFEFHATAERDGKEISVIRSKNISPTDTVFYELWADTTRDHIVIESHSYWGGRMTQKLKMSYKESPDGWILQGYQQLRPTVGGSFRVRAEYKTVEFDVNPEFSKSVFHIEPKPGFVVEDAVLGRTYVVKEDGTPGRDVAELWKEEQAGALNEDAAPGEESRTRRRGRKAVKSVESP